MQGGSPFQPVFVPELPVGCRGHFQSYTTVWGSVYLIILPPPSPFTKIKPASWIKGVSCSLLQPFPFPFHKNYPSIRCLHFSPYPSVCLLALTTQSVGEQNTNACGEIFSASTTCISQVQSQRDGKRAIPSGVEGWFKFPDNHHQPYAKPSQIVYNLVETYLLIV